jgi:hypothetical protein
MKTITTILFGLMLSVSAWAGAPHSLQTVHDLHLGCKAWTKMDTDSKPSVEYVNDVIDGFQTFGYITGFVDATPGLDLPHTAGEVLDAVCKDIDLHPALWKSRTDLGLLVIIHNLYGKPSKESK